jgi:hypothetical protein
MLTGRERIRSLPPSAKFHRYLSYHVVAGPWYRLAMISPLVPETLLLRHGFAAQASVVAVDPPFTA